MPIVIHEGAFTSSIRNQINSILAQFGLSGANAIKHDASLEELETLTKNLRQWYTK